MQLHLQHHFLAVLLCSALHDFFTRFYAFLRVFILGHLDLWLHRQAGAKAQASGREGAPKDLFMSRFLCAVVCRVSGASPRAFRLLDVTWFDPLREQAIKLKRSW